MGELKENFRENNEIIESAIEDAGVNVVENCFIQRIKINQLLNEI